MSFSEKADDRLIGRLFCLFRLDNIRVNLGERRKPQDPSRDLISCEPERILSTLVSREAILTDIELHLEKAHYCDT